VARRRESCEALEERGVKYANRISANDSMERDIQISERESNPLSPAPRPPKPSRPDG
jgi:hypothetical protein